MRPQIRGAKICFNLFVAGLWLRWKNLSQLLRAWILLLQKILGHPRSLTGENSTESITLSYFLYESQSSKKFGDNCYNHKKCLSPAVIVRQGNTWNLIICSRFGRQRRFSHNTQIIGGNWFIGRVTSMKKARLLEIFLEKRVQPLQPSKIFYEGTAPIRNCATVAAPSSLYFFCKTRQKTMLPGIGQSCN